MEPAKSPVAKWFWIILIIVALIGAGFLGWWFLMGPGKKTATPKVTPSATTPTPSQTSQPAFPSDSWLTYTNSTYNFSIKYPPTLSYKEPDAKSVFFQTAEDKAVYDTCMKQPGTDCNPGNQINIMIDAMTNDTYLETGKTMAQIAQMRVDNFDFAANPQPTTLDGQPAYEDIWNGLFTWYDVFSYYQGHDYDLTITCDGTLAVCKSKLTADQTKMISTFKFLK